jgi:hypothetical protein
MSWEHTQHTSSTVPDLCQGTTTLKPQQAPHTAFKQPGHRFRQRNSENAAEQLGTEHRSAEEMSPLIGPPGVGDT